MIEASVRGIGFWAPGVSDWTQAQALIAATQPWPAPTADRPAPAMMPANERRRAPDSVLLALTVADQACTQTGTDRAGLASVFASAYGDLAINDYMCATLADEPTALSPTKFHNSVHNAPSGYWSIATGAMAPTTAVAGYRDSFAMGLLEATTQMRESGQSILLVAYDVAGVGPMAEIVCCAVPFGCAFLLDRADDQNSRAHLKIEVRDSLTPPSSPAHPGLAALAASNPTALGAGALLQALAVPASQQLALPLTPALHLAIQIQS